MLNIEKKLFCLWVSRTSVHRIRVNNSFSILWVLSQFFGCLFSFGGVHVISSRFRCKSARLCVRLPRLARLELECNKVDFTLILGMLVIAYINSELINKLPWTYQFTERR